MIDEDDGGMITKDEMLEFIKLRQSSGFFDITLEKSINLKAAPARSS